MLYSLKTSYRTNENKTFAKRIHEIVFRDEGPSEPTINVKIEPRKSKRSRICKSFGAYLVAYALESELQIFKEVISTPEAQILKDKQRKIIHPKQPY